MKIRKETTMTSMTFTATQNEKMNDYSPVGWVSSWRGECANEYATHLEYVENGGWEKDYFDGWLNGSVAYPDLSEIIDFCTKLNNTILLWLEGVEAGIIDSEAGWED